jgi:hypothetical protein
VGNPESLAAGCFIDQTIQPLVGSLPRACEQFLDASHEIRAHRAAHTAVADLDEYLLSATIS